MTVVIAFDIHREQVTFDALDDVTGELRRGRIAPADRLGLRRFLASLPATAVEVALEATTGWRFIVEELVAAGVTAHLAEPAETASLRGGKARAKTTVRTRVTCVSCCSRVGCRRRGRLRKRSSSCV